ncbi:MAG: fatty acyl-AMP ligase [Thermosynechococcaceae cyanobacterium]
MMILQEKTKYQSIVNIARQQSLTNPDRIAFTFLEKDAQVNNRWTYQVLDENARSIAAQLQAQNMQGERALLLYPQGLEFIAAFLGCLYAGVVAVPAYPPRANHSMHRLSAIAVDAEAAIALTTQAVLSTIQPQLDKSPILNRLPWLATDTVSATLASDWQEINVESNTLAFLQYTSGSTGTPKGVMVSHGNIIHNERMIQLAMQHTEKSIIVGWLPLFHDMGLIGNTLQPLYCGAHCIFMSPVTFLQHPIDWLTAISQFKATTSGGPNFAYDLCVRKIKAEQRAELDLSHWDVAFNGAEPIRAETLKRFAETFAPYGFREQAFYPCFGMAETTLIVSGAPKASLPIYKPVQVNALAQNRVVEDLAQPDETQWLVSSGRAVADQQIVIANPETHQPCQPNEIGEIWVSGPNIALGYWNQTVETQDSFQAYLATTGEGPFFRTGDMGFLQAGELFVTGRLKDLIIIGGRNHYPQDIELTMEQSHSAFRAGCGAAFSIESESNEHLVVIQEIEREYLRKIQSEELITAIRKAISQQHELQVSSIVLLKTGSIPKTSSGKIQRHACRAGFLTGSLNAIAQWPKITPQDAKSDADVKTVPALV